MTPRQYGPHDEGGAPISVTILPAGKWPTETRRAVPKGLLLQRKRINEMAHLEGVTP